MSNENQHIVPIELLTKFLASEAIAEEIREVEVWRNTSPENVKEFEALQKLWNSTGSVSGKEDINLEHEWKKMERFIIPTRTIAFKKILQIAASIAILCIATILGIKQWQTTIEKTDITEVTQINLPDGSKVSLNAGSKISYQKSFGITHRELTLTGEAHFEVVTSRNIPFVISAYDARIEVVGTEFYVKAYKNQPDIKVTVTEGTVKLYDKKQPENETLLTPGETGIFNKSNQEIKVENKQDSNDIAWKTHKIYFSNTSMNEAAEVLSNAYHYEIIVAENIKNCTITVSFENLDITTILKVLKSTLDLKIVSDGKRITITGDGC